MKPVAELLKAREITLRHIGPDASVFDALKLLADHEVGALAVLEQGRLVGILSERDYTRKVALQGKSSKDTRVGEIMTRNVVVVGPQTRTRDCMALMSQNKIRHLPVVDGEKILGMLSIRDIMDDMLADHELTIAQLQSYIHS